MAEVQEMTSYFYVLHPYLFFFFKCLSWIIDKCLKEKQLL